MAEGYCRGDLVGIDVDRPGLDRRGLYLAVPWPDYDSARTLARVTLLDPLTKRGRPRQFFPIGGIRYDRADYGRYWIAFQVRYHCRRLV